MCVTLDEYVARETITPSQASVVREAVAQRQNFLVAGSTYSGKTTLMNSILSLVEPAERIYTIEQVPELKVAVENWTPMEADPDQGVTARELVQTAMRYSPNRIILGELRGQEAYDWLDALNTGHPGSGATIHADGAADALQRLESLVMMAETGIPYNAIQQWIGRALNVVFFIQYRRGVRRLAEICHLNGFDRVKGEYSATTIHYGESHESIPVLAEPESRDGAVAGRSLWLLALMLAFATVPEFSWAQSSTPFDLPIVTQIGCALVDSDDRTTGDRDLPGCGHRHLGRGHLRQDGLDQDSDGHHHFWCYPGAGRRYVQAQPYQ